MTVLSKVCGVYQIRNLVNNKRYVGSAAGKKGLIGRWNNHRSCLIRRTHHNQHLQASWDKHGSDAFVFEVLAICESDECLPLEQKLLDSGKFEYNIFTHVVDSRGYRHTTETREKISASHVGREFSVASRKKMSEAKRYGENSNAKIKPDDVIEIRRLLKLDVTQADIASQFGVSRYVITDIKRGRTWGYIK
tara:strand:- start:279 stop:854 length:576 start_codon:yes stop_codon:yes gene_type:complete